MKTRKITALIAAAVIALSACSGANTDAKETQTANTDDTQRSASAATDSSAKSDSEKPAETTTGTTEPPVTTTVDLYATSPTTYVEEQPYSCFVCSGRYTGEWKGDRPEGLGTIQNDNSMYSGVWVNGVPAYDG